LPAIDLKLEHESTVEEAGKPRQVKAALKAVAFGAIAERLARQAMGSLWLFQGFLATPGNGKHPVLHIQDFQQD
jgi:primosomal replication protein N